MRPRNELILRGICYGAAVLLLLQAVFLVARINPLHKVKIPELPVLTNATATASARSNQTASVAGTTNILGGTNAAATNLAGTAKASNVVLSAGQAKGTGNVASILSQTNRLQTNAIEAAKVSPTGAVSVVSRSNSAPLIATGATNTGTSQPLTNASSTTQSRATNAPPGAGAPRLAGMPPGFPMPGMPGGPGMSLAELPKETRAKLERIVDSELLAPVMRPMPLALLGIAGEQIFLRGPNGQTGLIKTGETLGGVKLLKIGINRVLVEEDGQSKELTIFGGMGGESLMSSSKTNSP